MADGQITKHESRTARVPLASVEGNFLIGNKQPVGEYKRQFEAPD
jgi:hypothetical protein